MGALDWTDPATIGYPVLVLGVLIGSIVPVLPTGAVVGAAAAVATTTDRMSLVAVVLLATVAALVGDVVTVAAARAGGSVLLGWVTRGQPAHRLATARARFAERGWLLVVVGRVVPAGRVPVLLAAGALDYPWRRLLPAAALGCVLWALVYTVLGLVSGGLFDSPGLATLVATAAALLVTAVAQLIIRWRRASAPGGSAE